MDGNNTRDVGAFFHLHGTTIIPFERPQQAEQPIILGAPTDKKEIEKAKVKKVKKVKKDKLKNFRRKNPGNCRERSEEYYERQHASQKNLNWSPYEIVGNNLQIWSVVVKLCRTRRIPYVVDLGCGAGHFAKLLKDGHKFFLKYWGYDFSGKAVKTARKMVKRDTRFTFEKRNVLKTNFTKGKPENTVYTAFEFLEHINDDLNVVHRIPRNTWFCFSVPNYWTPDHVRVFQTKEDITKRYGSYFQELVVKPYYFQIEDHPTVIQFLAIGRTKPESILPYQAPPTPPKAKIYFPSHKGDI